MTPKPAPVQKVDSEQKGVTSPTINDTFFNRLYTRIAHRILGKLHKSAGVCTPISRSRIIKTGHRVCLREAATMKFVAEHTSTPVPKVYCSFVYKDRAFILMERIRGDAIPNAWARLPEAARQKVYSQLKDMIQELRSLKPPPGTGVESCVGGELFDSRISRCPTFGPFKTIQDFHFWLRDGLTPSGAKHNIEDGEWRDIEKMVAMQDASWPPPVFTHGDLNPANIIVRGDKVVGIIDWEFAGWYPHYWEYTSAFYGNVTRTDWQDAVDQFLEPFPAELEMEGTRNRWWGEI
jgi:serine/threonine protein kinase